VHQKFNRVGPYTREAAAAANYSYGQPAESATMNSL
jgi:hypothetical protein